MYIEKLDKSIVDNFINSDAKAFEMIYNLYAKELYKRVWKLLRDEDEVDEIVHQVFLKLWHKRSTIDSDKNLFSFLLTIAHSLTIDSIRRNLRTEKVCQQVLLHSSFHTDSVEDYYVQQENWKIIEKGIASMPQQRRQIFRLAKIEGKSYQEISELLAISTSTVSNQLVVGMKYLRKFASDYEQELKSLLILYFLNKK